MLDDKLIFRTLDFSMPSDEISGKSLFDENKFLDELSEAVFINETAKEDSPNVAVFNSSRFNVLRSELELAGKDLSVANDDKSVHEIDGRPAYTAISSYIEEVSDDETNNEVDDLDIER